MRCAQGMSVTTKDYNTNNYAHIHVLPKCVSSLLGFMCFVLMFLCILVFTLSLVSDVSPLSRKVFYVNFISPRIRNSKYKVLSSGCCSPTLSFHRQLNLYPKFLHISPRENGSFEVLSSQNSVGCRQLKKLTASVSLFLCPPFFRDCDCKSCNFSRHRSRRNR